MAAQPEPYENFTIPRRVVVPFDLSAHSLVALRSALKLSARGSLFVVHVIRPASPVDPAVLLGNISDTDRAEQAVKTLEASLVDWGFGELHVDVLVGSPGREVCRYAASRQADVIVVASHGRTGIQKALLGSVAEAIVRHSPCPVFVLRGPVVDAAAAVEVPG